MPTEELAQIRRELLAIKHQLELEREKEIRNLRGPAMRKTPQNHPAVDFGLFLLAYFFWLVAIITAEIALGMGIPAYSCYLAAPCAWLTILMLHRKPLYTLAVAVAGTLFIAGAAYLAVQVYDTAWSSNCYYKPVTGMLTLGWNPFRETMIEFANAHDILPYNAGWLPYQVNNQPKASFMIAAAFYALTGNIESGKIFNLVSMAACVCIAAPFLRDAFRLNRGAALLAVLLAAANPITLSQLGLFYNDAFAYQMLTIAVIAFAYILFRPQGGYVTPAFLAAFLAIAIAVNVKMSAVLYAVIICVLFGIGRLIAVRSTGDAEDRNGATLRLLGYFGALAVCAIGVLGASTYITNRLQNYDFFFGMLGDNSMNTLLPSLMSDRIQSLPLFAQFFVSLLSPTSNTRFTNVNLKLPFTFSHAEWTLATCDANIAGWGVLFSGIFLLSVIIIIVTAVRMYRHSRRAFWILIGILFMVLAPAFVIPYLFCARYYLQPFWIPLSALVCLLAPSIRVKSTGMVKYPVFRILKIAFAAILSALLVINASASYHYFERQRYETQWAHINIAEIRDTLAAGDKTLDVTTIEKGLFYGLFFNLRDAGIAYNFCENLPEPGEELLYYLTYLYRESGPPEYARANSFLRSLYQNGYLVVIAANGGALTPEMEALLREIGLMQCCSVNPGTGYMAIISPRGDVLYECDGYGAHTIAVDSLHVSVKCSGDDLAIVLGGTDYAYSLDGYNIVVYDTENDLPVAAVAINMASDSVFMEYPVRIGLNAAQ